MKKILHLTLKFKWYDMQESGVKPEEYREYNNYWKRRILGKFPTLKVYTHVLLRRGYTKRYIIRRIESITIGYGNPEWGAPTDRKVFIIKHTKDNETDCNS